MHVHDMINLIDKYALSPIFVLCGTPYMLHTTEFMNINQRIEFSVEQAIYAIFYSYVVLKFVGLF